MAISSISRPHQTTVAILFLLFLSSGCEQTSDATAVVSNRASATKLGTEFDATSTGTISGRVNWSGEVPTAPAMRSTIVLTPDFSQAETILRENPNLPWVDPMSNGVRHPVVSLQNVD